ncbi:MAG: hypothetical protein KAI79_04300 [Bacteroidales bacterium]|nr:hypothetical protein [Bacteroidales bacterium]
MIEIKLTGIDAEEYLKQHTPDTQALATALQTATEYIDLLEKQRNDIKATTHTKVDKDIEIIKEIETSVKDTPKPKFMTSNKLVAKSGTWTQIELNVIQAAMEKDEHTAGRTLDLLLNKLSRTESAIRSKLNTLGIVVKKGVLHHLVN